RQRQQIHEVPPGPQLDQSDPLVDVIEGQPEDLGIEALGRGLVANPQDHVVQLDALEPRPGRHPDARVLHHSFPAAAWSPRATKPTAKSAMLTVTARRWRRENSSGARSPAGACWARIRAAYACGRRMWPA